MHNTKVVPLDRRPKGASIKFYGARRAPENLYIYIGRILSQAPVIDMKCNLFTRMGAVTRSPFASAIYHHR